MSVVTDALDGAPVTLAAQPGIWRRLLKRPVAVACLAFLALLVIAAVLAPVFLPDVSAQRAGDLGVVSEGPSAAHWLGTDTVGRDVLGRLLVGTGVTLLGAVEALAVVLVLGLAGGILAGYFGGWIDRLVNWLADLAFSIPAIIIIVVVLAVFPQSLLAAMVTLGVLAAPGLMRLVRSATLPVRQELYVSAAEVAGLSRTHILIRHVLPRIAGPVVVQASLLGAVALLVQTGLAFLGLLVQDPAPSWGGMVANGIQVISSHPWLIWPPGAIIALTVLAVGLLGDAVRDASVEVWAGGSSTKTRRRSRGDAPAAARRERPQADQPRDPTTLSDDESIPSNGAAKTALMSVTDLAVSFTSKEGVVRVVEDVSFDVQPGECIGIVGESGCGKSITGAALLGLLPRNAFIAQGSVRFEGRDLTASTDDDLRQVRGKKIAFVSQEPMIGLDPAFRIDAQLREIVRLHNPGLSKAQANDRVLELLRDVRLPDPRGVARKHPHELSGGMAQRVSIARALAGNPALLIADEPTTALDVTIQAEILDLFRVLRREHRMAIVIITHDWGVVAELCDRAIVMYGGEIVERASVGDLFHSPKHPYTKALLASNPHGAPQGVELPTIPGSVPAPGSWPAGCRFRDRCAFATEICEHGRVELLVPAPGRESRCRRIEEVGRS